MIEQSGWGSIQHSQDNQDATNGYTYKLKLGQMGTILRTPQLQWMEN